MLHFLCIVAPLMFSTAALQGYLGVPSIREVALIPLLPTAPPGGPEFEMSSSYEMGFPQDVLDAISPLHAPSMTDILGRLGAGLSDLTATDVGETYGGEKCLTGPCAFLSLGLCLCYTPLYLPFHWQSLRSDETRSLVLNVFHGLNYLALNPLGACLMIGPTLSDVGAAGFDVLAVEEAFESRILILAVVRQDKRRLSDAPMAMEPLPYLSPPQPTDQTIKRWFWDGEDTIVPFFSDGLKNYMLTADSLQKHFSTADPASLVFVVLEPISGPHLDGLAKCVRPVGFPEELQQASLRVEDILDVVDHLNYVTITRNHGSSCSNAQITGLRMLARLTLGILYPLSMGCSALYNKWELPNLEEAFSRINNNILGRMNAHLFIGPKIYRKDKPISPFAFDAQINDNWCLEASLDARAYVIVCQRDGGGGQQIERK